MDISASISTASGVKAHLCPEPAKEKITEENIAAFRAVLKNLFETYPARDPYAAENRFSAEVCRHRAFNGLNDPRHILAMACDTGVPNDILLGAYAAIFL